MEDITLRKHKPGSKATLNAGLHYYPSRDSKEKIKDIVDMKSAEAETDAELTITDAALLLGLSPELLSWLTSHAPKSRDIRKLEISRKVGAVMMFRQAELIDFNKWLAKPWYAEPGKRPHIPSGIKTEIVTEAGGACAICHTNPDSCEAAHIDPVAQSKNNHPHNLIWLCANHHTVYDKGKVGPRDQEGDFVKSLKISLLSYRKIFFSVQAEVVRKAFYLLEAGARAELLNPTTPEQVQAVNKFAEEIIGEVLKLSKVKKSEDNTEAFDALAKLDAITASPAFSAESNIRKRLHALTEVREEIRLAAGMVKCPLCKGAGHYSYHDDCPVCGGDGAVESRVADYFDPSEFDEVKCELCEGSGHFDEYDSCPICHGDTRLERRIAERTDFAAFRKVRCRLCKGGGTYGNYDNCPFCSGRGEVARGKDDTFDPKEFGQVRCDVCNGRGSTKHYDTCRKCDGKGELEQRLHELRDRREYEFVECLECKGSGQGEYGDCRQCRGHGQLPRYIRDNL